MKNIKGIWLPDHEEHLLTFARQENWTYQKNKLDAAVKHCPRKGVAVDVGGHCGLWAMHLCKIFETVHSFEPVPEHRECYVENVQSDNYFLHPYALGKEEGLVSIHIKPGSSGGCWVKKGDDVQIKTLDSFGLAPDFIKIDTEGHELFVLMGGEETIKKYKPTIIVEQKPGNAGKYGLKDQEAVTWLVQRGYKLQDVISGDFILT